MDEGGDPACWLEQVCDACGRLVDERPPPATSELIAAANTPTA